MHESRHCNQKTGARFREHTFSGWVGLLKLAHSKNTIDKAVSIFVLDELFYADQSFLVRVCSNWKAQKHIFFWMGWIAQTSAFQRKMFDGAATVFLLDELFVQAISF